MAIVFCIYIFLCKIILKAWLELIIEIIGCIYFNLLLQFDIQIILFLFSAFWLFDLQI